MLSVLVAFRECKDRQKIRFRFLQTLMAKLLRRIQHKPNWDPQGDFSKHLKPGHAPADALHDIATTGNRLSVWQIDDQQSNLERVLAAIASPRENLQKLDYLLFDENEVRKLGIPMHASPGDTHDEDANKNWHFHLTDLSAADLANLANRMLASGPADRRTERQLIALLSDSVQKQWVERSKLNPTIAAKLQ